jgi:hypothetical protein
VTFHPGERRTTNISAEACLNDVSWLGVVPPSGSSVTTQKEGNIRLGPGGGGDSDALAQRANVSLSRPSEVSTDLVAQVRAALGINGFK